MHKARILDGFTKTYRVDKLVYLEGHHCRSDAFVRERRIKEWQRAWKIRLILSVNSEWEDVGLRPEFLEAYPEFDAGWQAAHGSRPSPGRGREG
jgi:putative endonuclease